MTQAGCETLPQHQVEGGWDVVQGWSAHPECEASGCSIPSNEASCRLLAYPHTLNEFYIS